MKKIAVIYGGKSTEHDISVKSSKYVLNNLDKEKYQISEVYIDKDGNIVTAHSTNPVPLCYISNDKSISFNSYALSGEGKLADLAPTLLKLMDLEIPDEMTGKVLI